MEEDVAPGPRPAGPSRIPGPPPRWYGPCGTPTQRSCLWVTLRHGGTPWQRLRGPAPVTPVPPRPRHAPGSGRAEAASAEKMPGTGDPRTGGSALRGGMGAPGGSVWGRMGARGCPLFPDGAEEEWRSWGRVASGGEMCLSVQQGLRAGNVPAKVWCPSMVWPWHPVEIVGEGKGHLAPEQPAWAGGQPGDPQGSPNTAGSTSPHSPHTRVHTHAPRYTRRAWL